MHNHISQQYVLHFQHQVVRDLAWSLWGPPLLIHSEPYNEFVNSNTTNNETSSHKQHFPLDEPWLNELDQQPEVLITYLEQKNTRLLGTYFEALWQFYFSHHASFTQCICNLQINDDKRTVGEFDVLVTNARGENFHIELTCKFYLEWHYDPQTTLWLGPNCGDRLDIKFHKTSTHQLPLFNTEPGQKNYLQQRFNNQPVQQLAIWRGTPFYQSQWLQAQALGSTSKLEKLRNDDTTLWFIADKSLWLSPATQAREALTTYEQISHQINDHFQVSDGDKTPFTLMLIALEFDTENLQWQQQQRFFITPNNWPYGKLADSALTPLRPCKPPL